MLNFASHCPQVSPAGCGALGSNRGIFIMNFEHLVTSVVLDVPLLYHRFLTKDSFISVSKERGKE